MKKINMLLIFLGVAGAVCGFCGCGTTKVDNTDACVYWNSIGLGYMDEDGYYFLNNEGMLHYFDISANVTVPVCDKAECKHQPLDYNESNTAKCNAQLDCLYNGFSVYKNKIYYYKSGKELNRMELHARDLNGSNDKKIATLKANNPECEGIFYANKLLTVGIFYASESFDPETRQSEDSYLKLFLIDLETGETKEVDRSTLIHNDYAYGMRKGAGGKIYYYRMQDNQFYNVDINTGESKIEDVLIDDVAFDGSQFDKEKGVGKRYTLFRGDYCFGESIETGKTVYFRLNLLNGDIDNYLEKESIGEYKDFVGDPLTGNDVYYIQKNFEHPENNKIFICDINKNELIELGGKFITDPGYNTPFLWTDTGAVFDYRFTDSDSFEYRYISRKNLMEGKDSYQKIYEQIQ